jgi:sugar-specific transcriptional regulator TrmB
MAIEVSYLNTYGYAIDTANLKNNIKLVCDNAASKTANSAQEIVNQNNNSTNSALLSEYAQNIAKSNVAQQFVLDNNLKETLKFLRDEAAKDRTLKSKKYKFVIQEVLTDGDIFDYENDKDAEQSLEENIDNLESFDIKIDESTKNIFAA